MMASYAITKTVKIDFSDIDDKEVAEWAKCLNVEYIDEIPNLEVTIKIALAPEDLSDELIRQEYEQRFRSDLDAIGHSYQLIAAGDVTGAMDLMAREFNLAPPAHEKKIADLLSRARGHAHVQD